MKRVFYFSGHEITAYHWLGDIYAGSYSFSPTENGFSEFEKYLEAIDTGTVKLLADVIEEDFIKENIPHVGKIDQNAYVKRYIDRHYRKSDGYYAYKIIGRDPHGRKDDIALLSVLTNPRIFNEWMDIIQKKNTAISGIWSLPFISEKVIKGIINNKKYARNILLVSRQVPGNLRQSFFVNGKFEISRNAVVNLDDMSLGEYISFEVEQTSRFLANQRYIGFDDVVDIHIVCDSNEIDSIKLYCEETPIKIYHFHAIDEVKKSCGCSNVPGSLSAGLFAHQCNLKNDFSGHYGQNKLFSLFYQKLIKKMIIGLNLIAIFIASIFAINNLINAHALKGEVSFINKQKYILNERYKKEFKNIENELSLASAMRSSVSFYEYIGSLRNISPQAFMNKFSLYLQKSGVQDITITNIDWSSDRGNAVEAENRSVPRIMFSPHKQPKHFVKIKGVIGSDEDDFDYAVSKVNAILSVINSHKDIEYLEIIKMPYDIRPESDLNNAHSYDGDPISNKNHRSFEFDIMMKGDNNAS